MFAAVHRGLWNTVKAGLMAASIWTCVFSAILWFFSKPTIPYLNFVQILAPYALVFFGTVALVFECLTQWIGVDSLNA